MKICLKNTLTGLCCAFVLLILSTNSHANRCDTPPPSGSLIALHNSSVANWQSSQYRLTSENVVIPVQFHVIRRNNGTGDLTNQQIFDQIDCLNQGYRETRYRFYYHGVTRTNNSNWASVTLGSQYETSMKNSLSVATSTTLNVYVCPDMGQVLGWAYFPGDYSETNIMNGVVIASSSLPGGVAPYGEGKTLVHEAGHYLGLYHTFFDDRVCDANNPQDYCDDTPGHTENYGTPPLTEDTCPSIPGNDPVHNYMNYVDDQWMTEFTADQSNRSYAVVAD